MNIQTEKLELLKMILETDNPRILESIRRIFVENATPDFWENLSIEQKNEISTGIKEIENGDIVDYDELMIKHRI